jgi:tRNA threonylcarbamoyladenosine biosynthesis protein TsaB
VNLLALDTSSLACSVALQYSRKLYARHEEQPREHTRLLVPMIRAVLEDAEAEIGDLDAIVLGNGPGSFIGMRIAASVSQGMAFGAGLKIVPVSSMAGVAAEVFAENDVAEVVVTQDAHMDEVYLGIYRRDETGLPFSAVPERLQKQESIAELETASKEQRFAAGFGWQRYPLLLSVNEANLDGVADVLHPNAQYLLPLGEEGFRSGQARPPEDVVPAYLRQKVAKRPANARS